MYDASKVITGIIIFVLLVASPLFYNLATGQASYVPELKTDDAGSQCVRSKEFMKARHMELLNQWRTEVVRGGDRFFTAPDGKVYEKSLTNTCMNCHTQKEEFCDKCHDYTGVGQPKCWNCHNEKLSISSSQPIL